jgi:hypothetical protein
MSKTFIKKIKFLETTMFVDCRYGEVSIDVTRDGKLYLEYPHLGIVKTDSVLLGKISRVRLYYHHTNRIDVLNSKHFYIEDAK